MKPIDPKSSGTVPLQHRMGLRALMALVAVTPLVAAPTVAAQAPSPRFAAHEADPALPRIHVGAGLAVAQAVGEFRDYVTVGAGAQGSVRVDLDDAGRVGLRLQGAFVNYGTETQRVCLSSTVGCRIEVDLTTSNNIVTVGLGPELALPVGGSRLYGNALVGLGYFSTDSQVRGGLNQEPFASSRNFGDGGLSWSAGGGVEIPVAHAGGLPISLDLGLSYHGNGRREYLTRGGIIDLPDGSLEFDVKRSDADFLMWRMGVSVGVRPGR